jgi:acetolactate synthase-1/3 small subunit
MKEKHLLTIKADDAPGLMGRILVMLTRRRLVIESITMAKTDINSVVLISIELLIAAGDVRPLQLQIEKIIEVFITDARLCDVVLMQKLAFYKLSTAILQVPQGKAIHKYGAQIVNIYPGSFVISKSGNEQVINELYCKLEGKYLLGFAQSGTIGDIPLLESNDEWRIIGLAA